MHIHFLDPYRYQSSPVHRLDARTKLVLTLAFILTVSLVPQGAWPVLILLLALILAGGVLSAVSLGLLWRRSALALPFMLAALPLLFTLPGERLVELPAALAWLEPSAPGLERFATIAFKSWISVQAAVLLTATTPFPAILSGLRALGLPQLLVATVAMMWRYLFILADEALRLGRARLARSGSLPRGSFPHHPPGGGLAWRARVMGGMAGSLFLRSMERSDRIYAAMLARGYNGELRQLDDQPLPAGQKRLVWFGLGCLVLLLIFAFVLG